MIGPQLGELLRLIDLRLLLDLLFAFGLGVLVLGRVTEARTLWLLRGYLLLVALAWVVQRYANLPLTSKLVDALVLACSLALAILWQGELRRLMELLGTGRIGVLFGSRSQDQLGSGSVAVLSEAAGRLSQARRGGLIVVDLGSDLRPEDFLNPGIGLLALFYLAAELNPVAGRKPEVVERRLRQVGDLLRGHPFGFRADRDDRALVAAQQHAGLVGEADLRDLVQCHCAPRTEHG